MKCIELIFAFIVCVYFVYAVILCMIGWAIEALPKTNLGKLNYCLCQWFWFRIKREFEPERFYVGFRAKQTGWGILFVAPLTGWDSDFWPKSKSHHLCNVKQRKTK